MCIRDRCLGGLGPSSPLYLIEGALVSSSSEICISVIAMVLPLYFVFPTKSRAGIITFTSCAISSGL